MSDDYYELVDLSEFELPETEQRALPEYGVAQQSGMRSLNKLVAAWPTVIEKLGGLLEKQATEVGDAYSLEHVEVKLGFEGGVKLGITGTANAGITLKFARRKPEA